jgi:hypothetical protein
MSQKIHIKGTQKTLKMNLVTNTTNWKAHPKKVEKTNRGFYPKPCMRRRV